MKIGTSRPVLSDKGVRRHHRFKASIRGTIEYLGVYYHCLVEDISEQGLQVLTRAAIGIGERINVYLRVSDAARIACAVEARHVNGDGLGAEIVLIGQASSRVLTQFIEERYSAHLA